MTRSDDIECVGKVEFQMECVETNAQGKRHYYELKKMNLRLSASSRLPCNESGSDNDNFVVIKFLQPPTFFF